MDILDLNDLSHLIGTQLTEEVMVALKLRHNTIRIKQPGYAYTQEYRMGRLNVDVNAQHVITGFHWG